MVLNIKPDITDPEVIKLLPFMIWHRSESLCGIDLFKHQHYCTDCLFGNNRSNCILRFSNNPHLELFIEQVKQQYPEYFI